ncbi:MAG: MBL fold metallo-hydrolase [Planctomycetota bacterium]|nr:MBL fold metallo-hydrolase [Planctomycetota bacterium]
MDFEEIDLKCIVSAPFEENTFVVRKKNRKDCFIIDPGLEPQRTIDFLDKNKLTPASFLITHGHSDHIGGNQALKQRWPDCPVVIGCGDAGKLTDPQQNLSAAFGVDLVSPPADVTLDDGEVYETAGFKLSVLEIPGHSPGHVVYHWADHSPQIVLVGDVIFAGSIGRTDFPDGNFEDLKNGIHQKLFTLPDDTILYPGHGPSTTVGKEKATNPFVGLRG